jgi:hypothetical protein
MPENTPQWLWYAFFFGGSLGGWVLVALCGVELVAVLRDWRRKASGK